MSIHPKRPTHVPRALAWGVLPLLVVGGCSPGSTQQEATGAPVTRRPAPASATLSTQEAKAVAAARPDGVATCAMLRAARAKAMLGGTVGAGVKDRRKGDGSRRQLDGCSYTGAGGTRLSYLVWEMSTVVNKATVSQSMPSKQLGARTFNPKIGKLSAGAVLVNGPMAIAQVNAAAKGRLVQVTVTTNGGPKASAAATSAAKALMGG